FRAPNLDDVSRFNLTRSEIDIPSTNLEAERMNSIEVGTKFDRRLFSGSVFYFKNDLFNLLQSGNGTYNGQSFIDYNNNGTRDSGEPRVRQLHNVGKARLHGYEIETRVNPSSWFTVWGNYMRTVGVNDDTDRSLSRIQPKFGTVG